MFSFNALLGVFKAIIELRGDPPECHTTGNGAVGESDRLRPVSEL
jgi:hypothetical protein